MTEQLSDPRNPFLPDSESGSTGVVWGRPRGVAKAPELAIPTAAITAAVAALNANDARLGIDRRDGMTLRLGKMAEEYGEVWKALIGMRGQNPRKGRTHSDLDVVAELYDLALTALVAAASIPGGPPFRYASFGPHELWDCMTVLGARVGKTVRACQRGCANPHARLYEVASRALSIAASIVGPGWGAEFVEHVETRTARVVEAVLA